MDGALNIRDRIIEDARQEADEIIQDAETKANQIVQESKLEGQEIRDEILKEDMERGREQKRRMLSAAHMDIRKKELEAKLELLDETFEYVLTTVREMPNEEYESLIFDMLKGLHLNGDEEVVFPKKSGRIPSESIIERLNNILKKDGKLGNIQIASDRGDFEFGFTIRAKGVEMNNSLEAILSVIRDEIETEVANILFKDKSEE